MKKIIVSLGLMFAIFGITKAAQAATLTVSPTTNVFNVGQAFNLDINLDTVLTPADSVDIYLLHFNPNVLQVTDSDTSLPGIQIAPAQLFSNTAANTADNSAGTILFSQSYAGGSFTGSAILATISFQAIAAGTSDITLDFVLGSSSDTNVAFLGVDQLIFVANATVSVLAPISPTASISANPTSVIAGSASTLTWSTTNASVVTLDPGIGPVGNSGSMIVFPSVTTTYILTASNSVETVTSSVTVTVTPPIPVDTTPPIISSIGVSSITSGQGVITWTTDELSTSQVQYGTSTSYGKFSPLNTGLVINHSVKLSKLAANTTYHFRVISKDAKGNLAQSADNIFKTLIKSGRPHGLTGLTATSGSVILKWAEPTEYYAGIVIDRSTQGFLTTPDSSLQIADISQADNNNQFKDTNVIAHQIYYYSLFTYDDARNYSVPTTISFTPQSGNATTSKFYKDGTLILDNNTIYAIENGQKRAFVSMTVFQGLGYKLGNVITTDSLSIPQGQDIVTAAVRHPRGSVVIGTDGTVYFLGRDLRYPFPSMNAFTAWGNQTSALVKANEADLALPLGVVITPPSQPILLPAPPESSPTSATTLMQTISGVPELAPGSDIKFESDATVYEVLPNNEIKPFSSATEFLAKGQKFKSIVTLHDTYKNVLGKVK